MGQYLLSTHLSDWDYIHVGLGRIGTSCMECETRCETDHLPCFLFISIFCMFSVTLFALINRSLLWSIVDFRGATGWVTSNLGFWSIRGALHLMIFSSLYHIFQVMFIWEWSLAFSMGISHLQFFFCSFSFFLSFLSFSFPFLVSVVLLEREEGGDLMRAARPFGIGVSGCYHV